jgi:polar amino acid transport system substrate-binding protein
MARRSALGHGWKLSATAVVALLVGNAVVLAAGPKDMVPADIKAKGSFTVVTDPSFGPPWSFHPNDDPNQYDGIDVDIARGIADTLGLKVEFVSLSFDGIIPALKAGRYDLAMAGMSDTEEREKQIDMIGYVNDSTALMVPAGNPKGIKSLSDLCGKTATAVIGTFQLQILQDQSKQCAMPIEITPLKSKADTFLQVKSGRADATLDGYAVSAYLLHHGMLTDKGVEPIIGLALSPAPLGIGLSKSEAEFRDAVDGALNEMINSGTYGKILTKWGIAHLAVKEGMVNEFSH